MNAVQQCCKVVFHDLKAPLRTDAEFKHMMDELGIGMVSSFVLDYIHLVCLGNVRKLVCLWIKGPLRCWVSVASITVI